MTDQLNLLLGDRHAWAWVNDSSTPKWALTIGHVRRPTRRWRMLRNLVRAYDEMLAGKGRNVSSVALAGEDSAIAEERLSMPVQVMSRTSAERMLEAHDGDTDKVHTPFLSRHEVSWGRDPHGDSDQHVFVDASFFPDGPGGMPVSSYSIHSKDGLVTYDLSTALTSVEAEISALQHALIVANKRAERTKKAQYVFSDCTAALTKVILRKDAEGLDLLGEHVFVQWTPGHYKAAPGMVLVDQSARARVRELAAD